MAKAKPSKKAKDNSLRCPDCDLVYPRSALRRKIESLPGIRRPGGGPNGARTNYFLCCPKGHKVAWIGFKVS